MTLKHLLAERFDLLCKKTFLDDINRELDKYAKYKTKANKELYIAISLVRKYNELYPDDKIEINNIPKEVSKD